MGNYPIRILYLRFKSNDEITPSPRHDRRLSIPSRMAHREQSVCVQRQTMRWVLPFTRVLKASRSGNWSDADQPTMTAHKRQASGRPGRLQQSNPPSDDNVPVG